MAELKYFKGQKELARAVQIQIEAMVLQARQIIWAKQLLSHSDSFFKISFEKSQFKAYKIMKAYNKWQIVFPFICNI